MESYINLYSYGRRLMQQTWGIDLTYPVNRLYYVNSGSAVIHLAHRAYPMRAGMIYIFPQTPDFHATDAVDFDHTYFNYFNSRILRYGSVTEIDGRENGSDLFFAWANELIMRDPRQERSHAFLEPLLKSYLLALETYGTAFPYITNEVVAEAAAMINQDAPHLTTALLAQRLNLNESYLIRLFRTAVGVSPMKYIRSRRALYGKELILRGESVTAAAEQCGYGSIGAFCRVFRAEFGYPPTALKKIYR